MNRGDEAPSDQRIVGRMKKNTVEEIVFSLQEYKGQGMSGGMHEKEAAK